MQLSFSSNGFQSVHAGDGSGTNRSSLKTSKKKTLCIFLFSLICRVSACDMFNLTLGLKSLDSKTAHRRVLLHTLSLLTAGSNEVKV